MSLKELELPLDAGLVTLRQYGDEIGWQLASLYTHWRTRAGFPEPVGAVRVGRQQGGGRPEPVYRRADLGRFRAAQPDLGPSRSTRLIIGHDDSERVTIAGFAALAGVPAPDPGAGGCPQAGPDGHRRLGDLVAWQNARPAPGVPELVLTPLGPGTLVTLGAFARIVRRDRKTVTQYRDRDGAGFPPPAEDRKWRLEALAAWWNSRPGSGRRAAAAGPADTADTEPAGCRT